MKPAVYFFPAALLSLWAWCIWKAAQGWWRAQRLAERIGEIGHDHVHLLTPADFKERRK